jgi:hypothetical protein
MRFHPLWFALMPLTVVGCGLFGKPVPQRTTSVYMASGGSYGKAVLVVSPFVKDEDCHVEVKVKETGATTPISCTSDYVVACDVDIPETQPFCTLVREIGTGRRSAYPAGMRR